MRQAVSQGVVLADLKREFRAKSSVHALMGKLRLKRAGPGLSRRQIPSLAAPSGSGKNGVVQCGLRVLK